MSKYFCPTANEVELHPGGGFDVCCDAPERHVTEEQIAEALQSHYPRIGMVVASGVTCDCGYWNGEERPGVSRPAGAQGRDGLNWHRAQVVLDLLARG